MMKTATRTRWEVCLRTIPVTFSAAGALACSDAAGPVGPAPRAPHPAVAAVAAARPEGDATHIAYVPGRPGGLAVAAAARLGIRPSVVFTHSLDGFAASLSPRDSARLAAVGVTVEFNGQVSTTRDARNWGDDRTDQRGYPLDYLYTNYPNEGAGVTAYVIDVDLDETHPEFGGRARNGYDAIDGTFPNCAWHATHVAGTIGGATVGVANQVQLVEVRVLDCDGSGTNRSVIAGVDWVVGQVQATPNQLAVANMSLSGSTGGRPGDCTRPALNVAVCNAIAAGIPFAVAAGNDGHDACYNTPASAPPALTVMASGFLTDPNAPGRYGAIQDFMPVWSNSGPCADLFAPGMGIVSSVPYSFSSTGYYGGANGTSMASPHVAGHIAQIRSAHPDWTPAQIAADILSRATVVNMSYEPSVPPTPGTPNKYLYTGTGTTMPQSPATCTSRGSSGKCR
jgi:subtilisin family serine protease